MSLNSNTAYKYIEYLLVYVLWSFWARILNLYFRIIIIWGGWIFAESDYRHSSFPMNLSSKQTMKHCLIQFVYTLLKFHKKFGPHKIKWLYSTSVIGQEQFLTWSFYSGVPPVVVLQQWHPLHSVHSTNALLPQRPAAWKLQHNYLYMYIHSIVFLLHRVFIIWPQRHFIYF